jgi:hypothetical protein
MTENNKLVVYINDHGVSTDTVRTKHAGPRYDYKAVTSLHRINSPDAEFNYGINEVWIRTQDPNAANYTNWTEPAGWDHELVRKQGFGWIIRFFATDPTDQNTFLVSGQEYDLGFDHNKDPIQVFWGTRTGCELCGTATFNDFGFPNNTPWGAGAWVYGVSPIDAQIDPAQWPGWDNGGDGWVWAPIPEPSSLALLTLAGLALVGCRRSRGNRT